MAILLPMDTACLLYTSHPHLGWSRVGIWKRKRRCSGDHRHERKDDNNQPFRWDHEMLERERLCRWKHWKSLYAGSSEDDRRKCDRCGDQQFSAGDDRSVPSQGKCDLKYHTGSSEPPSYHVRVHKSQRAHHQKSDIRRYLCPQLRRSNPACIWRKSSDQGIIFQQWA